MYSAEEQEKDKREQYEKFADRRIRDLQKEFYGERNVGATLSKAKLNCDNWNEICGKIHDFTKKLKGFLIISAPPGIGKTYFSSALLDFFFWRGLETYCINERSLMEKLRQGIEQGHEYHKNIKYICDHYIFMLDDFGSTTLNEWRKETLFSVIDERYESELPTVITTNLETKKFHEYVGDRGADRLLAKENTVISILPDSCRSYRRCLD